MYALNYKGINPDNPGMDLILNVSKIAQMLL